MQTSIESVEKRMEFLDRNQLLKKSERSRINRMISETRDRYYQKLKVTRISLGENLTKEMITSNGKYSLD